MTACSPFGPAGEFAASRHGALTRSQAADHGLTHHDVRRLIRDQHLTEPVPGVLVVAGSPATWKQRLVVATLASNGAGVVGARAAAGLLGMDEYDPGPLELLVPNRRRIELPGLVIRRGPMPASDIVEVDGIRATGIARTLCDIATILCRGSLQRSSGPGVVVSASAGSSGPPTAWRHPIDEGLG